MPSPPGRSSASLPTIVSDLGGLRWLSWVVTAYLLASTVVVPLYGRKRVLQISIVLFLLGSALCGMAQDMIQLILLRALQGLGGGLFGISLFGALFSHALGARLSGDFATVAGAPASLSSTALQQEYLLAFSGATHGMFLVACAIAAVAFGLSWLLREVPLRKAKAL